MLSDFYFPFLHKEQASQCRIRSSILDLVKGRNSLAPSGTPHFHSPFPSHLLQILISVCYYTVLVCKSIAESLRLPVPLREEAAQ